MSRTLDEPTANFQSWCRSAVPNERRPAWEDLSTLAICFSAPHQSASCEASMMQRDGRGEAVLMPLGDRFGDPISESAALRATFRQPRKQRVFGPHLKTIPAEHAPEDMSQTVDSARNAARRSGGFERADVGDAPSVTAARKIHDRDVVQRHVAKQLVGTKVQAQILDGVTPTCGVSSRFRVSVLTCLGLRTSDYWRTAPVAMLPIFSSSNTETGLPEAAKP